MDDILDEDLTTLYKHSIVLYRNRPVYVESVPHGRTMLVFDLLSQRTKPIEFSADHVKPPTKRIGMVNIAGSVIYVSRIPVRKYKVGYTSDNLAIRTLDVEYPLGRSETKSRVSALRCPEIADAMNNVYPSFEEAVNLAQSVRGASAFDRQFAVCCYGRIYYKGYKVGNINKQAKTIDDIDFTPEYKHLIQLLGKKYDTAISDSQE